MATCNRELSPILKRKEKERHMELVLESGKIHRILLNCSAICKLAHIASPNCIWFKLINNISKDLRVVGSASLERLVLENKKTKQNNTVDENRDHQSRKQQHEQENKDHELPQSSSVSNGTGEHGCANQQQEQQKQNTTETQEVLICPFQYVLAPLRENLYARARIVYIEHLKSLNRKYVFAYVHFIDEGYGAWMNTKCLAKMPNILYEHPWQAFPVALFKIRNMSVGNDFCNWPDGLTDDLIRLMAEYEYFKVVPVFDSRRNQNYYEYTRAEIYGLDSVEDDNDGNAETASNAESIGHRLMLEYFNSNISIYEKNGTSSNNNNTDPKVENIPFIMPFYLDTCFDRTLYDAKHQPLVREQQLKLTKNILMEIPRWRMKWPKYL